MPRSSTVVERGPDRASGEGLPPGALIPEGGSGDDRLRVVGGSNHSPEDETALMGNPRLVLVTASGFKVPLVTTPTQAARLLRNSSKTDAAIQPGDGQREAPRCRTVRRPRPVPVDQLLSRGRLVSLLETPLRGGAA
jgi:hypothetical protein